MKKFDFPLNTVLDYKGQVLDNLKGEHASLLREVAKQEEKVRNVETQYRDCCMEYEEKRLSGMSIAMIRDYDNYIVRLQVLIRKEKDTLETVKQKEVRKRKEVIKAKQEKASIEKLKEKKQAQYDFEYRKSEEQFIEEFVSNARSLRLHG